MRWYERDLITYVDLKSFYDGNGAEIKRVTSNWIEDESEWEPQPTKYYFDPRAGRRGSV